MSGLMSRAAILTVSRLSNFAIQLFSPLLLVRILQVEDYGRYQEFMIYAMLLTAFCSFAMDSSLTYFLPRFPERERRLISQTSAITLLVTAICAGALLLGKPLFLRFASYDFIAPLAAYVFCFVNLNWLEYYWIAKRQPHLVLYYSATRLVVRIGILLVVAYMTRDVATILWSLVAVEAVRLLLVLAYFSSRGYFVNDMRPAEIIEQLRFAVPMGATGLTQSAGRNVGKIVTSSTLGPASLAYYAAGSYLQPIVRVVRKGIEDAVYPDLVRRHNEPGGALRLWQRVNVLNFAMFAPAFVVLMCHAKSIVTILFTPAYMPAVPVFQIFAIFLVRRCFNTDVLIRTTGRSGFMIWGAIGALMMNVLLITVLAPTLGLVGPAIAFIAAEILLELYYAWHARRKLGISVADLADWRSLRRIALACLVVSPVLLAGRFLPGPSILGAGVSSIVYLPGTLYLAHRLGVADVGRVARFVASRMTTRVRG